MFHAIIRRCPPALLLTLGVLALSGCAGKVRIVHHAYESGKATVMVGAEKLGPLDPGDEVGFRLDKGRYDVSVLFHQRPEATTNWVLWLDRRGDITLLDPPR